MTNRHELRARIVVLRQSGLSRSQIKSELGLRNNRLVNEALAGTEPPAWTRRPNAKDDKRALARGLRAEGLTYRQIAGELGVGLGSVSLWVRDLPAPEQRGGYSDERRVAAWRQRWEPLLQEREIARQQAKLAAARSLGDISDRDVLIAGAVAYWAEGTKSKTYRRQEAMVFANSDPLLIQLFVRYAELLGAGFDRLSFRISIHETADYGAALTFWRDEVLACPEAKFTRPAIKRHRPGTNRRNTLGEYRGCLSVRVLGGAPLYRTTEGLFVGTALGGTRRR